MLNKLIIIFVAASLVFFLNQPMSQPISQPEIQTEHSSEHETMESVFLLKNSVQHDTIDELLEHCATDSIAEAMRLFPADEFENLSFFTTYYLYDDDLNFPTSVISFENEGVVYYFSGAEQWNPFASYSDDLVYGGNDTATVWLDREAGTVKTCYLRYYSSYDEFALSPGSPVDSQFYYDTLTKVTGVQFKCVDDGVVSIEGDTVYVTYVSYDMEDGKYTLSKPGILSERSLVFSPSTQEFVNYSSDPNAPGGDMVTSPALLGMEFDMVGNGSTVLSIIGDDGEALYSVEIEVDDSGAFLPNEAF